MNALLQYIQPPNGAAAASAATPIIAAKLVRLLDDPRFVQYLQGKSIRRGNLMNQLAEVIKSDAPEPVNHHHYGSR